jgi:hypothetical protein
LHESPEEKLKYISSNNSFEGSPHKAILLSPNYHPIFKKESFTLNGWENLKQNSARPIYKSSKAKPVSLGKYSMVSTISKVLNPEPKQANYRTLELKVGKGNTNLNFKYGGSSKRNSWTARGDESKQKI